MRTLNSHLFEKKSWLTLLTLLTILGNIAPETSWAQTSPNSVVPLTPAEVAEVKLRFIPETPATRMLQALQLTEKKSKRIGYVVLDTADRLFQDRGVQLRLRADFGKSELESNVKVREIVAQEINPRFFALKSVKCEVNVTPTTEVPSCSMREEFKLSPSDEAAFRPLDAETLRRLRSASFSLASRLFSESQEDFLMTLTGLGIWPQLRHLSARVFASVMIWKVAPEVMGLGAEISPGKELSLERWDFVKEPGFTPAPSYFEVSWKVPYEARNTVLSRLREWAQQNELEVELNPQPRGQL
jgi:hypothetical protein